MTRSVALLTVLAGIFLIAIRRRPKNIDLSTVPDRHSVQLTIYNSEDLTLVRETRKVSFKKGVNPLAVQLGQHPDRSRPRCELRFLTQPRQAGHCSTPPFRTTKPQMLYWNVQSELDGEATVEISYFTSGISWSADYVLVSNPGETEVSFEGFVRVSNNSGEEYEKAQVRLVVGKVNLVEKIAQLARMPMADVGKLAKEQHDLLRNEAARSTLGRRGGFGGGGKLADGELDDKPKQIIKEGSERIFHLHHRRH